MMDLIQPNKLPNISTIAISFMGKARGKAAILFEDRVDFMMELRYALEVAQSRCLPQDGDGVIAICSWFK